MKDIKAVFDIGNDVIKGVVFANDNEKNVILVKQTEPTQGIRKWKILDQEAFVNTLNKIIENFVKKLWGDFIDEVCVGISHPDTLVTRISEQKRIMKDEIDIDDVEHLSRIVADIATKNNYETIKIVPVCWIIDEEKKEKDPVGLKGKKLEIVADAFMVPKNFYNGLIESFDKVGLNVSDVVPNILAASEIVLDYDHKDLGTVLVDIWKNQTSYAIFEDGYTLGYGTIPIWGEDVTKDISIGMQIDIKEAEDIKKIHWTAIVDQNIESDTTLDIRFLTDIISARYEEIFDKINGHLTALEKDGRLPWWIILIWWAAKMPNVDLLSKNVFKLATFYGKDTQLGMGDISSNIQFINVLWAYAWSNKYMEKGKGGINMKFDFIGNIGKFFKDLF